MSLEQFLTSLEQDEAGASSDDSLKLLSGISRTEAHRLTALWTAWDESMVLDVVQALQRISGTNPGVEFDTVFKAGTASPIDEVREICVRSLSGSTDLELVTLFIGMLENDDSNKVRCVAAETLEGFADLANDRRLPAPYSRRVVDALAKAVTTDVHPVRGKALISLAAMPRFDATRYISMLHESTVDDDPTFAYVVAAMGKSGDRRWLPEIENALDSLDACVRGAAAKAFGAIAEDDDVETLNEPLDDHVLEVQLAAVAALKTIGTPSARNMLKMAEKSSEPAVQEAAKSSLAALKDEDELIFAVSPTMLDRGLYGAPFAGDGHERDLTRYDAPTQEGWANVDSEGQELDIAPFSDDIGEDMEDYFESDEFFQSSNN